MYSNLQLFKILDALIAYLVWCNASPWFTNVWHYQYWSGFCIYCFFFGTVLYIVSDCICVSFNAVFPWNQILALLNMTTIMLGVLLYIYTNNFINRDSIHCSDVTRWHYLTLICTKILFKLFVHYAFSLCYITENWPTVMSHLATQRGLWNCRYNSHHDLYT